jgi:hypothetical protein
MDGQVLLWVVVIALVACCLIPMIFMARPHKAPEGPSPGSGGAGTGDDIHRERNNGQS